MSDLKGKGAGTCTYTNPFTQTPTCVQMTGSAYQDEEAAVEYCKSPGMPGAVGTFEVGASCAAFDDENFGGVCVTGEGTPEETAAAFVEDPTNAMAAMGSCEVTIQVSIPPLTLSLSSPPSADSFSCPFSSPGLRDLWGGHVLRCRRQVRSAATASRHRRGPRHAP